LRRRGTANGAQSQEKFKFKNSLYRNEKSTEFLFIAFSATRSFLLL
jgi:hypothetical protein